MSLKYVSPIGAAADGIPARDLSSEEVLAFGGESVLLALECGGHPLYEKAGSKARAGKRVNEELESDSGPEPQAGGLEDN